MRRIAALGLVVSLHCVGLFAGTQVNPNEWTDLHTKALAATDRQDYQTALTLLTKCRELAQSAEQTAASDNDLGLTLYHLGQFKEAIASLQQAVDLWNAPHEPFGRRAETSVALAEVHRNMANYAEAERILRGVLATAPAGDALSHLDMDGKASVLDELGDIMREEGRTSESRQLLKQASRLPGVSWKKKVDMTIGLAQLDLDAHHWEESIAEWNNVAELGQSHGDASLQTVATRGLGQTWLDRGDRARAEPLLRSALAGFESQPSASERQIAATRVCLGQLYLGENKLAMAEEVLTNALQSEERSFGASNPQVAIVLGLLADTQARLNQIDLARRHLDRAVHIMSGTFGEQSSLAGAAMANWGAIEQRANNPSRAAELYGKAIAVLDSTHDADMEALRIYVMRRYAEVLRATHRKQEASAVLAKVKAFRAQ